MEIYRAGSRPSSEGQREYFSGRVRLDPVVSPPDPARVRVVTVTFEPRARTAWHTHPLGQAIVIVAGKGRAQADGGPVHDILPGDVVWFAPGERHWHGAAPETGMTHIAVQEAVDGSNVTWLEHVSDAEYAGDS